MGIKKNETSEERERRLAKNRDAYHKNKANETSEHRAERLAKMKKARQERKTLETVAERDLRLQELKEARKCQFSNETPEQRSIRLKDAADRTASRISNESSSQKTNRLDASRISQSIKRDLESPESRNRRLQDLRQRKNLATLNETESQRNERLKALREAQQLIRANVENFDQDIHVFAETICEVCTKRCYPNQCAKLNVSNCGFPHYLPQELLSKDVLVLCHRCKIHLSSNKKTFPPKAYWNNLDPGKIPDELAVCTQVELRLMSRIIPFIKIIKLDGFFGQYSFKGQAILFAQDVFEVTELLPKILPRSADTSGIVIILEELENLNIIRELQVCKERVNIALDWLIQNNPLYKDVQNVSASVDIQASDFVRQVQTHTQSTNEVNNTESEFKTTNLKNPVSRIVRSSWNQGDRNPFGSQYAGSQCAAMCLSAIIKVALGTHGSIWTKNIINNVLLKGSFVYLYI
jgi:hypothetical protein